MAGERESHYSSDSLSEDGILHNHSFSDSTDSEHDHGYKHREHQ